MAIRIKLNESNASRRCVPIWLVGSNGTTPITSASDKTFTFSLGGVFYGSGGSLSGVSSADGLYDCVFAASRVSVLGAGQVMYADGSTLPASTPFEVVPIDSYDSMRMGLFALPNAAAEAAGGLITMGTGTGQLHVSSGSVGLKAQTHSEVTIQGISNYANISNVTLHAGTHSNVTIQGVTRLNSNVTLNANTHSGATIAGILNPISIWSALRSDYTTPGSFGEYVYSQVTGTSTGTVKGVENYANISNVTLHAGTHSNVTIQGVTRVNSSVTPANAEYSAITVRLGLVDYSGATVGVGDIKPAAYSGVSVEVKSSGIVAGSLAAGAITSAKFASGAIDAVALATDAGQEIADRVLARNIEGASDTGRLVKHALAPLRNKVSIEGSTLTVYAADDTTSLWTAVITTGTDPVSGVDPVG
jgi:hypothetical protein